MRLLIINLEIERAMLGCILLGKHEYIQKLNEDDFTQASYKLILKAIKQLDSSEAPIDLLSVSDLLNGKMSNAFNSLVTITDSVTTAEIAPFTFQKIKEYTAKRKFEKAAHNIMDLVQNNKFDDVNELKANILQQIDIPLNDFRKKQFDLSSVLVNTIEKMETEYNDKQDSRLLTGYYDLDKLTAGLHPEELTIIAARPGQGKTTMALNIMINLAKKGVKSALISREMSQIQLTKRILANVATIDGNKLRICKYLKDHDWEAIGYASAEMGNWHMVINDELATVQEIRSYCRELKTKDQLEVLFVDYLQICKSSTKHESRRQEVEEMTRQFKEIAMELQIPVVVLSQLSRDSAKSGRPPELHDLRESGSIEQDADNVIFLHQKEDEENDIQIIVGKQRNGPTGYIYLKYYRNTFKLENRGYR